MTAIPDGVYEAACASLADNLVALGFHYGMTDDDVETLAYGVVRAVAPKLLRWAADRMAHEKGVTFADALMIRWLNDLAASLDPAHDTEEGTE